MVTKLKADPNLVKDVQAYLSYLTDAYAQKLSPRQISGFGEKFPAASRFFQDAYAAAGLSGVDDLLEAINESLTAIGCTKGFREGCALQQARDENEQSLLIVLFVDFKTDQVIADFSIAV